MTLVIVTVSVTLSLVTSATNPNPEHDASRVRMNTRAHAMITAAAGGYTIKGNFHDAAIPQGMIVVTLAEPVMVRLQYEDPWLVVVREVVALHEFMDTEFPFEPQPERYAVVVDEFTALKTEAVVAVVVP